MLSWLPQVPLIVLVALAAGTDLRSRRIPNWLTFALLGSGLAVSVLPGGLTPGQSLAGAGVGLGLTLVLFVLKAMAGGDAKLVAGIGAWVGPGPVLLVLIVAELCSATIVIVHSLYRRRLATVGRNALVLVSGLLAHRGPGAVMASASAGQNLRGIERFLPFAVSLLVGLTVLMLWGGPS